MIIKRTLQTTTPASFLAYFDLVKVVNGGGKVGNMGCRDQNGGQDDSQNGQNFSQNGQMSPNIGQTAHPTPISSLTPPRIDDLPPSRPNMIKHSELFTPHERTYPALFITVPSRYSTVTSFISTAQEEFGSNAERNYQNRPKSDQNIQDSRNFDQSVQNLRTFDQNVSLLRQFERIKTQLALYFTITFPHVPPPLPEDGNGLEGGWNGGQNHGQNGQSYGQNGQNLGQNGQNSGQNGQNLGQNPIQNPQNPRSLTRLLALHAPHDYQSSIQYYLHKNNVNISRILPKLPPLETSLSLPQILSNPFARSLLQTLTQNIHLFPLGNLFSQESEGEGQNPNSVGKMVVKMAKTMAKMVKIIKMAQISVKITTFPSIFPRN